MPERKRNIQLHFMVSENERAQIRENMKRLGTRNMGAYLRKMAVSGVWVELDLNDIYNLISVNNVLRPHRRRYFPLSFPLGQSHLIFTELSVHQVINVSDSIGHISHRCEYLPFVCALCTPNIKVSSPFSNIPAKTSIETILIANIF